MSPHRVLASLDIVITALRRQHFYFSSCDCDVLADDLAPARDYYAKMVAKARLEKAKKKPTSAEIQAVMREDIFRK